MFSGIKLLCMGQGDKERPFIPCLNSVIVPESRYLKISNKPFQCAKCGHKSSQIQSFFLQLLQLEKADVAFRETGFYTWFTGTAYRNCFEDDFPDSAYFLEHNDWHHWNLQIPYIVIADDETALLKEYIWEDCFYKARPLISPISAKLTFTSVLRRKKLYIHGSHEFKKLDLLKALLREIRTYNSAWVALLDSFVCAAPVALTDPIALSLNKVDNLSELFPGEAYD